MQRQSPIPETLSGQHFISKSEINQPSAIPSRNDAQTGAPPAAAVAVPAAHNGIPHVTHAQLSAISSAAQSLPIVDPQSDKQGSHLELSANAPEFKSIQELCFDAASFGISESGSKVSVVEYDGECNSSTSEHSSGPPLEVNHYFAINLLISFEMCTAVYMIVLCVMHIVHLPGVPYMTTVCLPLGPS